MFSDAGSKTVVTSIQLCNNQSDKGMGLASWSPRTQFSLSCFGQNAWNFHLRTSHEMSIEGSWDQPARSGDSEHQITGDSVRSCRENEWNPPDFLSETILICYSWWAGITIFLVKYWFPTNRIYVTLYINKLPLKCHRKCSGCRTGSVGSVTEHLLQWIVGDGRHTKQQFTLHRCGPRLMKQKLRDAGRSKEWDSAFTSPTQSAEHYSAASGVAAQYWLGGIL